MQIMKGYHCSSDSVNLRVPHSVCLRVPPVSVSAAEMYGGCCTLSSTHFVKAKLST